MKYRLEEGALDSFGESIGYLQLVKCSQLRRQDFIVFRNTIDVCIQVMGFKIGEPGLEWKLR